MIQDIDHDEIEETAWQWFAQAHPHEAYETWPERFWAFFHKQSPGVTREQMEAVLRETEVLEGKE